MKITLAILIIIMSSTICLGQEILFNTATRIGDLYQCELPSTRNRADIKLIKECTVEKVKKYGQSHNLIIKEIKEGDIKLYGGYTKVVTYVKYLNKEDESIFNAKTEYQNANNIYAKVDYISKYYYNTNPTIQSLVMSSYNYIYSHMVEKKEYKWGIYEDFYKSVLLKYPNDEICHRLANDAFAEISKPLLWKTIFTSDFYTLNTYQRCKYYYDLFGSKYSIEKLYDLAYQEVKNSGDLYLYISYIECFGENKNTNKAYADAYQIAKEKKLYAAFLLLKNNQYTELCHKEYYNYLIAENSLYDYVFYMEHFPNSQYSNTIRELIYKIAQNTDNLMKLEQCVRGLKGSQYEDIIIQDKDLYERSYLKCEGEWSYKSYMDLYGSKSPRYNEAKEQYEQLKRAREAEEARRAREEEQEARRKYYAEQDVKKERERQERENKERERQKRENKGACECSVGDRVYVIDDISAGTWFGYNVKFFGRVEQISNGRASIRISSYEILPGATYDYKNYDDTKKARNAASEYTGKTKEYDCSVYRIGKQ